MNCMKCGRETENETVFCQNCLQIMEKYPVRPGTVVLLPRRKETPIFKKISKRHTPTPEEQIATLRKNQRILILLLVLCAAAIVLMLNPTMHYVLDEHVAVGQNYSTVNSISPSITPTVK